MAENQDGQERSESATGKRIQDARRKGQIPRSREFNTMGSKITKLTPVSGSNAALGGGITLGLATMAGIPVSTTHTITGSIFGVGSTRGKYAVRWGLAGRIVMAWVLIEVINRRAFGWQIDMTVAPDILLSAIAFAIGAALLAGVYPAFRAGRSQPAAAMREE